ncbi:Histidine kinase [Mycena indigotica]|uniref:histidine kinase n=1 Tax=Mycena indigotica TaxID=2126181 RepID=A0A8H6T1I6_9AGAR|nr:Histidine kinase [Mycena indigotica]KAF7309943.1 Histidine kinase [Mycena indigotica]
MSSFRSISKKLGVVELDALPPPVLQKVPSGTTGSGRRRPKKKARFGLSAAWSTIASRFGTVSTPSLSSSEIRASLVEQSSVGTRAVDATSDPDRVDRIVVDRSWATESRSRGSHDEERSPETKSKSSYGAAPLTPFQEGWHPSGPLQKHTPTILWSVWAMLLHFFHPTFPDERTERHYKNEDWGLSKGLARWAAVWLIINWALGAAFSARPRNAMDNVFLYGIGTVLSVPIVLIVAFDWPRTHSLIYQIIVGFSIFMWGFYYLLLMEFCGFYPNPHKVFDCPGRDFIGLFYYTTALPVIGLFGLKMQRITAVLGGLIIFLIGCIAIVPLHPTLARTMVNYFLFLAFIIYSHYKREMAERRLYSLRSQLKIQFKETQRAQINERKASDSKRRLTSYVFHDKSEYPSTLPVILIPPLSVARLILVPVLAVQNINSSGIISKDHDIEFNALSGSLNMMRNVLNDVLDFNRMDSGTFEVSSRPFAFHTTMRSLFVPLVIGLFDYQSHHNSFRQQLATDARGQDFVAELDPNIDKVARWAAYQAMGETADVITRHMKEHPEVAGVVIGDHVRLRQIVNNLASNATKFTPAGGRIAITTKLLHPTPEQVMALEDSDSLLRFPVDQSKSNGSSSPNKEGNGHPLSRSHLDQHNLANGVALTEELNKIVVRIEVIDTGYGITRRDMDECNLFSAFNQTEQGKQQGGKGTGLGLALVRQIVKLSGGRLGVRSKAGEGSCFWIELPLGVGREALVPPDMESEHSSTDPDITKVRRAARSSTDIPVSTNSLTMAVDAVALKNSVIKPPLDRSSSAIHNIMEQGGRVELGLAKPSDALSGPTPTYTPSPLASPGRSSLDVAGEASSTHVPNTPAASPSSSRPTYLPMPSPKRFMKDAYPTASTNSGISSSSASSPMLTFDSNFQGIPTSNSDTSLLFDPGMSVLVVDDDLITRKLMQRMMTKWGCIVETAENGQAALFALGAVATPASEQTSGSHSRGPILERPANGGDEERFDIIFLDNQMPILSGLNAAAKLREWGRTDFIVGVTGNALLEDQEEYIAAGADHVLTKPVNEQALRRMLVLADSRRKNRTILPGPPTPPSS